MEKHKKLWKLGSKLTVKELLWSINMFLNFENLDKFADFIEREFS